MTSSRPGKTRHLRGGPGTVHRVNLPEVLHYAAREARRRLNGVASAVYLLDERRGDLRLALAGGCPPSLYT
ncbi:hypothetical protein, partial [Streptomyces sp. NPDC058964]|uniref:hypothetical protein n=1 Tax=Streptomyces sp. NPDC058964 TaxID=3346681 RepID=UPI0036B17737